MDMTPSPPNDAVIEALLLHPRPLPHDPVGERIVLWRTFRSPNDARAYAHSILLGEGQDVVGGRTNDSLGEMFWLGVQVADLAKWGNSRAIQLSGRFDPEDPDTHGRPFQ